MKILLTGATGMVGKNILEHENAKNFTILTPSSKELNLLSKDEVLKYFKANQPDVVIHCAAVVGGIQANIKEPVRFLVDNTDIGRNVLMAAYEVKTSRVINLASSCIYPKDLEGLLEEEHILTGALEPTNEGYAIAKISTMKLGQYINKEMGKLVFKTLIPCNLYGRWDKFGESNSHMVPAVIAKIHQALKNNSSTIDIWGSGNARREFMYTADLADFIFFALDNWEKIPETINVGLGIDHSINDYYKSIANVLGFKGGFSHDLSKPEGMKKKLVSVKKAIDLGWNAKTGLDEGIKKTYEFYLEQERK
jgi:GDP-L-fucose synthase